MTVDEKHWRRFAALFLTTACLLLAALYAFVIMLDPFGLRASPSRPATPIMDLNQRYMYPQVVRSGRFDSAVFGTSTVRLLDPDQLDAAFGGRFANLGMNAATPWEQMQLADLFLRKTSHPKHMIFSLDAPWCEADADEKRLTFRAFPPWLYDDTRLNDYPEMLNLTAMEIAGRVLLNRIGLMPERISRNGYEVFVPDEELYDLSRARRHIWGQARRPPLPARTIYELGDAEKASLRLPALAWLDDMLAKAPDTASTTLAFMPIHYAAQPHPGSREAAIDHECKARIADIGRRRGAAVIDFRLVSPVTFEDSNYWDPLHYRVGIATRVVEALRRARTSGKDAADGFYRVLNPPRP